MSADDFFVKANKLKISLNDPPFFMTFPIGKASGDGRPMIDKQSADFGKKIQFKTGRTLSTHRVSMLNCISINKNGKKIILTTCIKVKNNLFNSKMIVLTVKLSLLL